MDISVASDLLKKVLAKYNYKNLDNIFPNENTTTEFMCKKIFDDLGHQLPCIRGWMKIKLWEKHDAWASYSSTL